MAEDWDGYAVDWDEQPGVRDYAAAAHASLLEVLKAESLELAGATACDFGCGTGLLTAKLSPAVGRVIAIDSSPRMLDVLDRRVIMSKLDNVTSSQDLLSRERLDELLEGRPLDLVVCSSVCAFLDDYPGTVKLFAELLRPGGLFVQWDWELEPDADDRFGLTRDGMRGALTGAGLTVVKVDTGFQVAVDDMTMKPLMGVARK